MLRAISSARLETRLALVPGAGSSSYMVTTGPCRTALTTPLTEKSSSTDSSRRAFFSSAALSMVWPPLSLAGVSSASDGRLELANMSVWRGLFGRVPGRGCGAGSLISGASRGSTGRTARRGSAGARSRASPSSMVIPSSPSSRRRAKGKLRPASEKEPRRNCRLRHHRVAPPMHSSRAAAPRTASAPPASTPASTVSSGRSTSIPISPPMPAVRSREGTFSQIARPIATNSIPTRPILSRRCGPARSAPTISRHAARPSDGTSISADQPVSSSSTLASHAPGPPTQLAGGPSAAVVRLGSVALYVASARSNSSVSTASTIPLTIAADRRKLDRKIPSQSCVTITGLRLAMALLSVGGL